MGCNAHLFIEYKPEWSREGWWSYGTIAESRDYGVYAALAGVRNDEPAPIFPPRGLPDDLGIDLRADMKEDGDLHTHTWMTAREFGKAMRMADHVLAREWVAASAVMDALSAVFGSDRVRIIIAFDN